jgi:hypothetical protein
MFEKKCLECAHELRRSEIHNLAEFLMAPLIIPCRCVRCGLPAYRARFVVPPRRSKSSRPKLSGNRARPRRTTQPGVVAENL